MGRPKLFLPIVNLTYGNLYIEIDVCFVLFCL
jgi:hypothetical protein